MMSNKLNQTELYAKDLAEIYKKENNKALSLIKTNNKSPGELNSIYENHLTADIGIGKFEYVGKTNGNWNPIKKLPLPEKKMNFDLALKLKFKLIRIYNEILFSNYDKNLYSSIDDDDNIGFTTYSDAKIIPNWDN